MDLDIEDCVKKRKNCDSFLPQKKKLHLAPCTPERLKSNLSASTVIPNQSSSKNDSKENHSPNARLTVPTIKGSCTATWDEEFLHVLPKPRINNKVKIENECGDNTREVLSDKSKSTCKESNAYEVINERKEKMTDNDALNNAFLNTSDSLKSSLDDSTCLAVQLYEDSTPKLNVEDLTTIVDENITNNQFNLDIKRNECVFENQTNEYSSTSCGVSIQITNESSQKGDCVVTDYQETVKDENHCNKVPECHFDSSLDDWDFSNLLSPKTLNDLDLSTWQHCEVLSVIEDVNSKSKILQLKSTQSDAISNCTLRGIWMDCIINIGSVVSAKAFFQVSESIWVIDNNNGFLVEFPDVLLSPTTIVGSLTCMRRGILDYIINKPDMDEHSKVLVIGSLVHELLQEVMSHATYSPEFIATVVEEIISTPYNIRLLYSSNMSLSEARNELLNTVSNVQKFCKLYSVGCEASGNVFNVASEAWKGKIKSVIAIEDNYWIPQLGLKGKVDVTVCALEHNQSHQQLMPVEVKTGSAKNSVEHRGQVILYCLMAAQVTPEVDGGLLVYLKEGFARKVKVGRPEQRDIVLLRNKLIKYIVPQVSSKNSLTNLKLPAPTSSSRSCQWCPHTTVCATFLQMSKEDEKYNKTPAQDLRTASLAHLSSQHLDYVVHWSKLLWTEEHEGSTSSLKNLWTISPENRENGGVCFANLMLCPPVNCEDINSYIHIFRKKVENSEFDFTSLQFFVGQMIIVSTDCRLALTFGIITDIKNSSLTVDLPRDLSRSFNLYGDTYIIDVYEPKSNINWSMGNLAALLDDREISTHLRRLIIDGEKPDFDTKQVCSRLNEISSVILNSSQLKAIEKALSAKDYLLIRGFPGSGKSSTVAVLIQYLVSQGRSVLLTAHTHSAVDTVLLKLLNLNVDFLRIGSMSRIHEAIQPWSEHNLTKRCYTPKLLESTYNEKPVVAATCWGVKHALFTRRTFDVCIVDESTQVLQPVILGPLLKAKRFILVGDPEQLAPVVKSKIASKEGLSKCMFTQLDKIEATVQLDIQYRMNYKITELANILTYNGELKCASPTVGNATVSLIEKNAEDSFPLWIIGSLSCKLEDSIIFINVPKIETHKKKCINVEEAQIVKRLVKIFTKHGIQPDSIGVMATYRDQVKYLQSEILKQERIEINTVDQYQGRDKDIVIFSCTNNWTANTSSNHEYCILNDKRRMTVAITRAKLKFIMIGNMQMLKGFSPLKTIIESISISSMFDVSP